MWNILDVIKEKLCGISRSLGWFWALKFLKGVGKGVTQLYGVSRSKALFCLEFPRVK